VPWLFVIFCIGVSGRSLQQSVDAVEPDLGNALAEGRRLQQAGEFKAAIEQFQKALPLAERRHDERAIGEASFGIGLTQWGMGAYREALTTLDRPLAIFTKLGNSSRQASVLNSMGLDLYSMGRYLEALERYQQALEVNHRAPAPLLEGTILANIGLVHRYMGRFSEATAFFERSLRVRRESGDTAGIGQSLNHLGMVNRATGRYEQAIDDYRQSLAFRQKAGDRQGEAQTLNNLANVYHDLNKNADAVELFTRALAIAREIGYTAQVGFSNLNIGGVLADEGRAAEALKYYESALAIWRQLDRRGSIAETLNDIGELRVSQLGDPSGARSALNEALDISRAIKDPEQEAQALLDLGKASAHEGNLADAMHGYDGALAIARVIGSPGLEYEIRAERGLTLRGLGKIDQAIDELRASAQLVTDLRANVHSDTGKIGFLDRRQQVFVDLVETLAAAGRPEEALEAAEAARARAFGDLLAERDVVGKPRERQTFAAVRATLDDVHAAAAHPSTSASGSVSASTDPPPRLRTGDGLDEALQRLRSENEELASLVTVQSPNAAEIKETAARLHATFVEYMVTDRQVLSWVVLPDGTLHSAAAEISRSHLAALIDEVRRGVERQDVASRASINALARPLGELERVLVAPVEQWLPESPDDIVIFSPHAILSWVPFAALVDDHGRALIERHTVAVTPAVSVFRYTPAKRARQNGAIARGALVIADPVPPPGSNLARLPGSRVEGARVAAHLKGARLLVGPSATEAAVKQLSHGRRILHFATHGLVSEDRPLSSSLVLAAGQGEDGYLRVSEVFGLDLDADLVVLSGCSTGLGQLSGDGILGLTRAFIYAGTPSVVVSQWDVDDQATAYLMDQFYAGLGAGRGKAQALRSAQLATRARFASPALWAPFILVGEPQ
jgi:CHAT domain-containing protein/Tfp pilus assembly protein PilF